MLQWIEFGNLMAAMKKMPSKEEIKKSVEKVGYQNVILNPKDTHIFLKNKGMKIGLGGIGQGYIADKIKDLLKSKGCESGLVNVSGDIKYLGKTNRWKSLDNWNHKSNE